MVLIKCDRVWEKINWKRKVVHLSAFAVGQHVSASFGKSLLRHFLDRRLAGQVRHKRRDAGNMSLEASRILAYCYASLEFAHFVPVRAALVAASTSGLPEITGHDP